MSYRTTRVFLNGHRLRETPSTSQPMTEAPNALMAVHIDVLFTPADGRGARWTGCHIIFSGRVCGKVDALKLKLR